MLSRSEWDLTGLRYDDGEWALDVVPANSSPMDVLFGGAALGASIQVAAAETGTAVRWASTRFLAPPPVGERITLTLSVDAAGRRTTHSTVTASGRGVTYFDTRLVTGSGDSTSSAVEGQWSTAPHIPAPLDCRPIRFGAGGEGYAVARVERRLAVGPHPWTDPDVSGTGRVAMWARIADTATSSPAGLAWLADSVVTGVAQAIGPLSRATSLDNTIRVAADAQSEWVLLDVVAEGAADGYAYGRVDLYAEDGALLATGSQTCLCRRDRRALLPDH